MHTTRKWTIAIPNSSNCCTFVVYSKLGSENRPFRYDVNMRENNSSQNLEVKTNLPRGSYHTLHESYSSDFETLQANFHMNTLTSNLWMVEKGI